MTDKEIMINGVDVSGCRHFLKDTEGQDYDTDEFVKGCCEAKGSCIGYEFAGYGLCRGDKDCYFKQLARKTAECEKYEQALEEVYGIIVRLLIMKDVKHLSKEINDILNIINKAKDGNNVKTNS